MLKMVLTSYIKAKISYPHCCKAQSLQTIRITGLLTICVDEDNGNKTSTETLGT